MKSQRRVPIEAIDWQKVRRRLARAVAATAESVKLPPERAQQILQERARALACVPAVAPPAGQVLEVVTFSLARERYAVESRYLREVVRFTDCTPVPDAPAFVVGVINLRGEIVAVFDLRPFLGVSAQAATDLARVVVMGQDRAEFGVLADAVHEVQTLRTTDVLEPPSSTTGIGREYLRGVTQNALILLDGAVLLQDGRIHVDQSAETGV